MTHSILLIISGSIAAYKSLELIRLLRAENCSVECILTNGGKEFITPLSVSSLTGKQTYTDLFSLKDEVEMGHIQLSRKADQILVAPASADIIAKMVHGLADDLASSTLLAANKSIFVAPAMNHHMWNHPATQRNLKQLKADGHHLIEPEKGALACGENGDGRMASPETILKTLLAAHKKKVQKNLPLNNKKILIPAGPTYEPIDPVRFLGNRSSGKQAYAIAEALAAQGAKVILISGPTNLPTPEGTTRINVETAEQMLNATQKNLPADIAICAAAVADWTLEKPSTQKLKKRANASAPILKLKENPDILSILSHHKKRPTLVIGFAAETEKLEQNAKAKLKRKGCDWLLANSTTGGKTFGEEETELLFLTPKKITPWPKMTKHAAAEKLTHHIINYFTT